MKIRIKPIITELIKIPNIKAIRVNIIFNSFLKQTHKNAEFNAAMMKRRK
mgnify:CR=1 FL=1